MSDQAWAALIGLAIVVVLRILDYYFPRGYISKRAKARLTRLEEADSEYESDLLDAVDPTHQVRRPVRKPASKPKPKPKPKQQPEQDEETED